MVRNSLTSKLSYCCGRLFLSLGWTESRPMSQYNVKRKHDLDVTGRTKQRYWMQWDEKCFAECHCSDKSRTQYGINCIDGLWQLFTRPTARCFFLWDPLEFNRFINIGNINMESKVFWSVSISYRSWNPVLTLPYAEVWVWISGTQLSLLHHMFYFEYSRIPLCIFEWRGRNWSPKYSWLGTEQSASTCGFMSVEIGTLVETSQQ